MNFCLDGEGNGRTRSGSEADTHALLEACRLAPVRFGFWRFIFFSFFFFFLILVNYGGNHVFVSCSFCYLAIVYCEKGRWVGWLVAGYLARVGFIESASGFLFISQFPCYISLSVSFLY